MRMTLDWLGVSTFRLTIDDLVVFLDAYLDRVPAAPPVGLTTAEVTRADYVLVGHSHFDHLWGAERIAARTGATVIGSHETVRLLHDGHPRAPADRRR
jgi:L-ascorbate metabolism protein UlaG (beta-lactamase superfamily)